MYCVYTPIEKPEVLAGEEEYISLKCFQSIIESSKSFLYFLRKGIDGQLKCIKNKTKRKVTINTDGEAFDIIKKGTIVLIYDKKKNGWNIIYL